MTWEELKEKAKEMGYKVSTIEYRKVSFLWGKSNYKEEALTKNGQIYFTIGGDMLLYDGCVADTYIVLHHFNYCEQQDKMLMIMRGLE